MIKELNGVKLRTGQVWQFYLEPDTSQYRIFLLKKSWWGKVISSSLGLSKGSNFKLDFTNNESWTLIKKYLSLTDFEKTGISSPILDSSKFSTTVQDSSGLSVVCQPGQIWKCESTYYELGTLEKDGWTGHYTYPDENGNFKTNSKLNPKLWLGFKDKPLIWKFIRGATKIINGTQLKPGQIWIFDNRIYFKLIKQGNPYWFAEEVKRTDGVPCIQKRTDIWLGALNHKSDKEEYLEWKLFTDTLKSKCEICLQYE